MSKSYHLGVDIQGAIHNRVYGSLAAFQDAQGRKLTKREALDRLKYELAMGRKLLPVCDPKDCPDFDTQGGGCPGHETL